MWNKPPKKELHLEEAASNVCSAAAKLVIECDLDTFDTHLEPLKRAIRLYQN